MFREKFIASLLLIPFGFITACAQQESASPQDKAPTEEVAKTKNASVHGYGGWYCPDNLGGFPPVNVADLASVPVVNGRMPTKEETQNGTALMYFDPKDYPTAKPVNMVLPKLARYYSPQTKQNELVVIIQAVVVDADTVVGFRYVDGGNGSSWFNEVDFLTDKEVIEVGSTPFVFLEAEINASKEKIWDAITKTDYANSLGKRFQKTEFFEAPWTQDSEVDLHYETVGETANGYVMTLFGNLYLQINYDFNGRQAVEKILVMDNEDGKSAKIQIVFGPFEKGYEKQKTTWEKWLKEVKMMSEVK